MRVQAGLRRGTVVLSTIALIALIGLVGALLSGEVDAQLPGQQAAEALCLPFIEDALTAVGASCDGLNRNAACYGYNLVGASFTQVVPSNFFTRPSERGDIAVFERIETASLNLDAEQWGIALLSVQADLPRTLPGQSVLFMLVGDTQLENGVSAGDTFLSDVLVPVTTRMPANLYRTPALDALVVGSVPMGVTLDADAATSDAGWARVTYEGQPGWLAQAVLDVPVTPALPVYDGDTRTPMQSFYFRTGIGALNCIPAPSTLIVQGPQNVSVNLNANGADIRLGSTVALNTLPIDAATVTALFPSYRGRERIARLMQVTTLDGEAIIYPDSENPIIIPAGQMGITCLAEARNLGLDGERNDNVVIPACGWFLRDLTRSDLAPFEGIEGFTLNYPITIPPLDTPVTPPATTDEPGGEVTPVDPTVTPSTTPPTPTVTPSTTPTVMPSTTPTVTPNTTPTVAPPISTDLRISKLPAALSVLSGDTIIFTITLGNFGANTATGILVSDLLPTGLSYVTHTLSQGSYNPATGVWTLGTVFVADSDTLSINASVTAAAGATVINTATITSFDQTELTPADNTASATVNVTTPGCIIPNPVTNVTQLIAAIDDANNEGVCPGTDTINLLPDTTFTLTTVNNTGENNNGLPVITSEIIINGADSTIERSGAAPEFRLFYVETTGTLTLNNLTLQGGLLTSGIVTSGGALYNRGIVTLNSVVVQNNAVVNVGGGIYNPLGTLTINLSAFINNSAGEGGGIKNGASGTVTIDRSSLIGNTSSGFGAAIDSQGGSLTITNSTLNGNLAPSNSYGGFRAESTSMTLVNTTISGNSGGGIWLTTISPANISFTTIANNTGGAALSVTGSTVTTKNSIVSGTCSGTLTNAGGTYTDDPACSTLTLGTLNLGALQDNGGTTETHAIPNTSVAFNGAVDCNAIGGAVIGTDQRLIARPQGAGCDSGAYEAEAAPSLQSDVFIVKTVDNSNPSVGATINFAIRAETAGPDPANNVLISDVLPAGVTYVTHNAPLGTSYNPGTGDWVLGTMDVGTPYTLVIVVTVNSAPLATNVVNSANLISLNQTDPVSGNNSASVSFTVSQADINVSKSADTTTPAEGDPVNFTIVVQNLGGQNAANLIVNDLLPAGLIYTGHATVTGSYTPGTGDWNIGNLSNGQTVTLIINASVNSGTGGTSINNTAFVSSSGTNDPNATNDSDTVTLNVVDV
ncbi:MAG: choice-of-anchor Q domain-containing protein, partial [Chloroflexota bacterium]|nr:choice-of-anchor Q domain-containing protein [Chloroflexota bacterium]